LNKLPWYENISIEIKNILESGKCPEGHKIGERFDFKTERGKICPHALNVLFPYIIGLQSGGSFPWEEESDNVTICCPDPYNPVVFKLQRSE
jgi:uncharacterized repeat protein (TIGR04076 family)